jgi:hypothetical protein
LEFNPEISMPMFRLQEWQISQLAALEESIGRVVTLQDLTCVDWDDVAMTTTVAREPLLNEITARGLAVNLARPNPPAQ